ncbi:hypothetical protein H0H87_006062 [Tephrocybe sp. NHM501043]|nr:hypothetical protein H0H87_006062 [Tephrocybe sp. NHM501043]
MSTMLESFDTQMLDFQADPDYSMQVASSSDSWFQDEAIMEDDGHSPIQNTIEVDMEPYDEQHPEYEMADGSEPLEPDANDLVDVEVYDASRFQSPDASHDHEISALSESQTKPLSIAPDVNELSHTPYVTLETQNFAEPTSDVSYHDSSASHMPESSNEPEPVTSYTDTNVSSEETLLQGAQSTDHSEDGVLVAGGGDLHDSSVVTTEESLLTISVEPTLDRRTDVDDQQENTVEEENVRPPATDSSTEFPPDRTVNEADTQAVEYADPLKLDGSTGDPHEISEGVYIDPPPPVLVSISGALPISLFNSPSKSRLNSPFQSASDASDFVVLLGHLPTLYYETLSAVFESLRQEEYLGGFPDLLNGELLLDAYDLELTMSEANQIAQFQLAGSSVEVETSRAELGVSATDAAAAVEDTGAEPAEVSATEALEHGTYGNTGMHSSTPHFEYHTETYAGHYHVEEDNTQEDTVAPFADADNTEENDHPEAEVDDNTEKNDHPEAEVDDDTKKNDHPEAEVDNNTEKNDHSEAEVDDNEDNQDQSLEGNDHQQDGHDVHFDQLAQENNFDTTEASDESTQISSTLPLENSEYTGILLNDNETHGGWFEDEGIETSHLEAGLHKDFEESGSVLNPDNPTAEPELTTDMTQELYQASESSMTDVLPSALSTASVSDSLIDPVANQNKTSEVAEIPSYDPDGHWDDTLDGEGDWEEEEHGDDHDYEYAPEHDQEHEEEQEHGREHEQETASNLSSVTLSSKSSAKRSLYEAELEDYENEEPAPSSPGTWFLIVV